MERQRQITQWAFDTFGPCPNLAVTAARANKEVAELLWAATATAVDPDGVASEAADVYICACRLASDVGCDLEEETRYRVGTPDGAVPVAQMAALVATSWAQIATALVVDASKHTRIVSLLGAVARALRDVCVAVGRDLLVEVDAKMAVNRARQWVVADGHGSHVRRNVYRDALARLVGLTDEAQLESYAQAVVDSTTTSVWSSDLRDLSRRVGGRDGRHVVDLACAHIDVVASKLKELDDTRHGELDALGAEWATYVARVRAAHDALVKCDGYDSLPDAERDALQDSLDELEPS